jgi:hypothetical protein
MLKWIFKRRVWTGLIWLAIWTGGWLLSTLELIKGREFL